MASPKGFILYKIYYGEHLAYLGRTKQPLQARIRGHMFQKPMHRNIDIHNVSKIEYTECKSTADMYVYEIYYINLLKPPLNRDDKADDDLVDIHLPELEWKEFVPSKWEEWKKELAQGDLKSWRKRRNDRLVREWDLFEE